MLAPKQMPKSLSSMGAMTGLSNTLTMAMAV